MNHDLVVFFQETIYLKKVEVYVINLDDKNSKGTHLVSLLIDINLAAYFVSFGIKYISLELLNKIREKSNQLLAIYLESKIMNVKKD